MSPQTARDFMNASWTTSLIEVLTGISRTLIATYTKEQRWGLWIYCHLSQFSEILAAFGLMLEFRFKFDSCSSSNWGSFHFHAQDRIRLRFGLMFEFRFMIVKESCSSSNSISFQFRARVPIRVRFTFRARVPICVRFGFGLGCDTRTRIGDCGFVALYVVVSTTRYRAKMNTIFLV